MTNYKHIFSQAIDRLHTEGRYRVFIDILRNKGFLPGCALLCRA
jgi:5-aminolevulinate synthase